MAIKNVYSTAAGNGSNGNKKNSTTYVDKTGTYKLTGGAGNERAYTNVDPNADYKSLFTNPTAGTTTYYTGASLAGPSDYVAPADNKFNSGLFAGVTAKTPEPATPSAPVYDASADLVAAYNARQAALKGNYDAALNQRRQAYETAVGDLRNQGDEALRQAYINMMMNMRGLNQSLEAAGLRGGASESARAGLYNRYASDRNAISRAIAQQLANAGNEYGNDITELGLKYNQNGADAMSDYQNQIIKARQSLANQLAKTGSNANGITTDASAAWEGTPGVNVEYGSLNDLLASQKSTPVANDLSALQSAQRINTDAARSQAQAQAEYEGTLAFNNRVNQLRSLYNKPQQAAAYIAELSNAGLTDEEIQQIFNAAGYTDEDGRYLANFF